jgi:hypothetical protein
VKRRFTEELVADLARDLADVRPVARLRVVGVTALALWGAAVLLGWLIDGQSPAPGRWSLAHIAGLAGLGVAGFGGLAASFASAVPGRDLAARGGRIAAVLGIFVALTVGALGAWGADGQSYAGSLGCIARSIALAMAPLLIAGIFMARGAVFGLRQASYFALVGSLGLGALAVHATCPTLTGGHVLLGHHVGPLVIAVLASFPLASALARRSVLGPNSN